MLKLSSVFSDGALFLHSAPLVISGESDSMKVKVLLTADGVTVSEYFSDVADGIFSVTVQTPAPSFKKYEIRIESGLDSYVMRDVLFGELFLASGQSNMEWPTKYVPHREDIYEGIKG